MYAKTIIAFVLFLLGVLTCQAQREAAVWYFGDHAGLDFNTGSPEVLEDGSLTTAEGCATISDSNGGLLFYTDGVTVWNRNHLPMANGTDLKGHASSTQSAIIVPAPNSTDRYFIFTTHFQVQGGLYYSEVDVSLHNGLGAVVKKNVPLQDPTTEKLTAVQHGNGTDAWVLTHDWGNDAYLAYLVTSSGVQAEPIISKVGFNLDYGTTGNDVFKSRGYLKISSDGSKLAACHSFVGIELLDFNTMTGVVSDPQVLLQSGNSDFYGLEFSPYGDMLYASIIKDDIVQFNLRERDVAATKLGLNVPDQMTGALQLALDGKIYVAGSERLSVIEFPEKRGLEAGFKANVINLGTGKGTYGLPPFMTSYFELGIQAEKFCLGETTEFSVTASEPIDIADWDFGDGTTSNSETTSHQYAAPGDYTVQVTLQIGTRIKTETRIITIYEVPNAYDVSYRQCDMDQTGTYNINLQEIDAEVLRGQDPYFFEVTYFMNEEDAVANQNEIEKESYSNTTLNDLVYARVQHIDANACYALSEVNVQILPLPSPQLELVYYVCPDDPYLVLDGGDYANWSWRNGVGLEIGTSRGIELKELGYYSLTVVEDNAGLGCTNTIFFQVLPVAVPEDFTAEVNHFSDDLSILISVVGTGDFEYSLDGVAFQDGNRFEVTPGKYKVYVRGAEGCRTLSKEIVALGYQKFFTPNGDGINDFWNIAGGAYAQQATVAIFDRYGKLLQQLDPRDIGWNGTYQGLQLPSSDYWFRFEDSEGMIFKAHFTLKR